MVSTRRSSKSSGSVSSSGPKQTPKRTTTGAARKVKNKVASPRPRQPDLPPLSDIDSDDYNFAEEEESVGAAPASETDSASSKREKLPRNLLHQLALDINARGGIRLFNVQSNQALASLCDQRPELYGERGGVVRAKIQKKVQEWRELFVRNPESYLKSIQRIGVQLEGQVEEEVFESKPASKPAAKKRISTSSTAKAVKEPPRSPSPAIPNSVTFQSTTTTAASTNSVHSTPSYIGSINSWAQADSKTMAHTNTSKWKSLL